MMHNKFFDDYAVAVYCFTSAGTHLKINIHDFKFASKRRLHFYILKSEDIIHVCLL
jgi:hypothetical protein